MLSLEEVQKANRELALRINDEARSDPTSPYAGKYVGIANGQVVLITDDLTSLYYGLEAIEPDNRRVFWIEASRDLTKIEYIWRC
jgi:hypothetical protein